MDNLLSFSTTFWCGEQQFLGRGVSCCSLCVPLTASSGVRKKETQCGWGGRRNGYLSKHLFTQSVTVSQSLKLSVKQLFSQSVNLSTTQSISQSIITQSDSQLVSLLTNRSVHPSHLNIRVGENQGGASVHLLQAGRLWLREGAEGAAQGLLPATAAGTGGVLRGW